MKRDIVNCGEIRSIGYGVFSSKLEIEFKSGDIIQFLKVPMLVFQEIKNNGSYSDYYNKNIKGIFKTRMVKSEEMF